MKRTGVSLLTFILACGLSSLGLLLTAVDLLAFVTAPLHPIDLSNSLQLSKLTFLLDMYLVAAVLLGVMAWRVSGGPSAQRQVSSEWSPLVVTLWFFFYAFLFLVYYPLPPSLHHLDKLLFIIASLVVWSLLFTFHPRLWARAVNTSACRWTKIALVNVLLFLVMAEAGLRLLDPILASHGLFGTVHTPASLKPHQPTEGSIGHTNSQGFRDQERTIQKRPSTLRVLALGDSFTWGTGVSYDETIVTVLEQSLKATLPQTEIINLGVPGFEPEHELDVLLRCGIHYQPDLVILNFFVGNDIMRKRGAGREVPIIVGGNSYYAHSNGNWVHDHWGPDRWYIYHHLNYLIQIDLAPLRHLFRNEKSPPSSVVPVSGSALPVGWSLDYINYLDQRSDIFSKEDTTEWNYQWHHTIETLDALLKFLRARQIPLMMVLIPEQMQLRPDLQQEFLTAIHAPDGEVDFEKPQRMVMSWCAHHAIECVDLLTMWKDGPDPARLYFRDDPHWTREGHAQAASAVLPILYKELTRIASRESSTLRINHAIQ